MGAQTSYNFFTSRGIAGGLYDLSDHVIDARRNEENTGVLGFGLGVVVGTNAGIDVKLPGGSEADASTFEGVTVNGFTTEMNRAGDVLLLHGATVGVLSHGRIWVQVVDGITIDYGDAVYLVVSGADKGKFTNDSSDGVEIGEARFLGVPGSGNTNVVEFHTVGIAAV